MRLYSPYINKARLVFRSLLLAFVLCLMIIDPQLVKDILFLHYRNLYMFYIPWAFFMYSIVSEFLPNSLKNREIGSGKLFSDRYAPKKYDRKKLRKLIHTSNIRALRLLLFWITGFILIGILHHFNILTDYALYFITLVLYFGDQVCVNIWCFIRHFFIKAKCCSTCRVYHWDKFLTFSLLIYIPNFYTWSIVILSFLLMLQWEYRFYKFPERFFEISNANLMCKNCKHPCKKYKKAINKP
jgi:hypothetical protein